MMPDIDRFLSDAESELRSRISSGFDEYRWNRQRRIMEALYSSEDSYVYGIIPTGGGKSFIYQFYARYREKHGKVLVVEPLNAIKENQIEKYGDRACDLKDCIYRGFDRAEIIYTSPEMLYRFSTEIIKRIDDIDLIVIDEAHTLLDWGSSFRTDFLFISRLIRYIRQHKKIRVLLLTATLSLMQEELLKLYLDPDREPVVLRDEREPPKVSRSSKGSASGRIMDMIKDTKAWVNQDDKRGVLFFFNTKKEICSCHRQVDKQLTKLSGELDEAAIKATGDDQAGYVEKTFYLDKEEDIEGYTSCKYAYYEDGFGYEFYRPPETAEAAIIDFYGEMNEFEKEDRLRSIAGGSDSDTKLIIVLSTKALSMGIDLDVIGEVINIGLPDSMSEYRQEIGRVRKPDENTRYTILCSDKQAAYNFGRILPGEELMNILSVVSARIRIWDYIRLWYWYKNGRQLGNEKRERLDHLLKKKPDDVIAVIKELCSDADKFKKRIEKLFGQKITCKDITDGSELPPAKLFLQISEDVISMFTDPGDDVNVKLDFFDYMVFNALFTLSRQLYAYDHDTVTDKIYEVLTGYNQLPRKDKKNSARDEILDRIDLSVDKLAKAEKEGRKLFDPGDMTFPFTDNANKQIIAIDSSLIGNALCKISGEKRVRINLVKLVAVHYTLTRVESARRFFDRMKKVRGNFSSYKVPYAAAGISDALSGYASSHYSKYQVPGLFETYMQEALVAVYEFESEKYWKSYFRNTEGDLYEHSARGAYGLEAENPKCDIKKAEKALEEDKKENLIINKYWLRAKPFKAKR